jgi:carboxymethylenebutenolidase
MNRRDLMRRVLLITGSIPMTASVLTALGCGGGDDDDQATPLIGDATAGSTSSPAAATAAAATATTTGSSPSAANVDAREVRFPGPASELIGYLARPQTVAGTASGIIVIHENRGLVEHIKDVARRYAEEGFIALAVDLVSRQGGSKSDEAANTGALGSASPDDFVADLRAYVAYLMAQPNVRSGGVGATGFCFGGGYTFELLAAEPNVKAAVPYYGSATRPLARLAQTQAAVLVIYAERDTRITGQAEDVRKRLQDAGKTVEIKVYAATDHAFFNNTGSRYNAEASADAWAATLAWFRTHLPQA